MDYELDRFKFIYKFNLTEIKLYKNNSCFLIGYLPSDNLNLNPCHLACTLDQFNELLSEFDKDGDILLESVYQSLSSGWQDDISISLQSITGYDYLCFENLAFIVDDVRDLDPTRRESLIRHFYNTTDPGEVKNSVLVQIDLYLEFIEGLMSKHYEENEIEDRCLMYTQVNVYLMKLLSMLVTKYEEEQEGSD